LARCAIGHARQPAPDDLGAAVQPVGIDANPNPKHQLVALVLGFDRLGRELRLAGEVHDLGRNDVLRVGIEHDASIGAEPDPARIRGRQIGVHVDIRGVEHGEDLAAGGQHFADIRDAVFDAALARRHERVVEDVDPVELDVMGGGVDGVFRPVHPLHRRILRGFCRGQLLAPLIALFDGGEAPRHQ
jgi:hypothetical protein